MILKQFFYYIFWTLASLLVGVIYMKFVLNYTINTVSLNTIDYLFNQFLFFGLWYVGLILGGIIALLFIITDIVFFNRKPLKNFKWYILRFFIFLVICFLVIITHYVLEKVIDII